MKTLMWLVLGGGYLLVNDAAAMAQPSGRPEPSGDVQRLRGERDRLQAELKKVEDRLREAERPRPTRTQPGFDGFGAGARGSRSAFGPAFSGERRDGMGGPGGFGGGARSREGFGRGGFGGFGSQGQPASLRGIEDRLGRLERQVDRLARDVERRHR